MLSNFYFLPFILILLFNYSIAQVPLDLEPPNPIYILDTNCCRTINPNNNNDPSVQDMPLKKDRCGLKEIIFQSDISYNMKLTYEYLDSLTNTTIISWKAWAVDCTKPSKAVITFVDKCGNDTTITIECSGITDKVEDNTSDNLSDFEIYPNPADNTLNLKLSNPNSKIYYIRLYDIYSNLLEEKTDLHEISPLSLSNYSEGIYFIQIKTENGTYTRKLNIVR